MNLEELNEAIKAEEQFEDLEHLLFENGELNELCETGSVTVTVTGEQYVLSLKVEEA